MKKESFSAFDAADYLKTEEDIAAYLQAATDDGDPQVLFAAMGDVVRARNVSRVARETGLTREGIYKALSPEGNPSFATFWKLANALNIRFSFGSKSAGAEAGSTRRKGGAKAQPKAESRDRITITEDAELRYWAKELGVPTAKLKSVIRDSRAERSARSLSGKMGGRRVAK